MKREFSLKSQNYVIERQFECKQDFFFGIFRPFWNRALVCNPALFNINLNAARSVSIKVVPTPAAVKESHDERNLRFHRPQSPHLTIYKPQLTSMLSITHRGTGIALTGYAAIFAVSAITCTNGPDALISAVQSLNLGAASLATLKFALAFPFAFHTVNGVRHLFWDLGKFLTIKEVYTTGYAMIAVSTIFAIALTLM